MIKKYSIVILSFILLSLFFLSGCGNDSDIPSSKYSLNITTEGQGTVTLDPDQDSYQSGTAVDITAVPDTGYNFDHWEGAGFSGNSNENIEMVMDSNYNLRAVFTDDNSNSSDYDRVVEVKSEEIDLDQGGTIEITDQESHLYGLKININGRNSQSVTTANNNDSSTYKFTISRIDNPNPNELDDYQNFVITPFIIDTNIKDKDILSNDVELEIKVTEAQINNAGVLKNSDPKIYKYVDNSWNSMKTYITETDIYKIKTDIDNLNSARITVLGFNDRKPDNLGNPRPGDLLYKLGNIFDDSDTNSWRPGHVGIYVGEKVDKNGNKYNVIEAKLMAGVVGNYYQDISSFSHLDVYMGAREAIDFTIDSDQRKEIVKFAESKKDNTSYAWKETILGINWGLLRGDSVKTGNMNCVGLAEAAYEYAEVNEGIGLVSDEDEGNNCIVPKPTCVLTPPEQYNKTQASSGYSVSGTVEDENGNQIEGVEILFESVFQDSDYHYDNTYFNEDIFSDQNGYWETPNNIGRQWNIKPVKEGWTFEPEFIRVEGFEDSYTDINFIGTKVTSKLKWTFKTGGNIFSSPAIGEDGTIYVGCQDHNLYAINKNGAEEWRLLTSNTISSSPAIGEDGTIYVGSNDGNLYAVNPDGTKKWSFNPSDYAITSSPAIAEDGIIYVASRDNNLYAVNSDGTEKWSFKTDKEITSSPAIGEDGTIYVGSDDNNLYAVNPDGTEKWSFKTRYEITSSPAIGEDGTIYVGSDDYNLYAVNPDGTEKWNIETGYDNSSPAIGEDGTIYVGGEDTNLYAINPDGTEKWSFETDDRIRSTPAIAEDGTIYFGSHDHNLYAINPDGTKNWEFETGENIYCSPTIAEDGTIYIGSFDNKLYAIEGDSNGIANSPWPKFQNNNRNTGKKEF